MTEEDEAFNDIERQSQQRKEAVRAAINKEKPMNNPPAFPTYEYQEKYGQMMAVGGMTLRDYFAAKAMQGLIASPRGTPDGSGATDVYYAKCAYLVADAMMNVREQ